MQDEYDFSNAKRGAVVPLPANQTEVRLRLDNEVLDWLRERVNEAGDGSYQDIINAVLWTHINAREAVVSMKLPTDDKENGIGNRKEVSAVLQGRK